MPLRSLPSLHWLWVRLLIACRSVPVAWALLWVLGTVRWLLQTSRRRQVKQYYTQLADIARTSNQTGPLTRVAPATLTRRHFIQRAILGVAPALAATAPLAFLRRLINYTGVDAIANAAAGGRGTVIAGTHFGSLGITPALLAREGHRVLILRDQQFKALLDTRHGQQFFLGAEPLFLDHSDPASVSRALLKCARSLSDGAIVAYTADASHGTRTTPATIFGRTVHVRTALVEVAMRTGAHAAYGFSHVKDGQVHVQLSAPVLLEDETNLQAWCQEFCSQWQNHMVQHPEAISWHKSDLALLAAEPEQNA